MTHKIVYTDKFMGKQMTEKQRDEYEWKLWEDAGGYNATNIVHQVNPYKFARTKYSMYIDPEQIINAAYGNNRMQKLSNFQILTDPRIAPYTDPKAVADDVIEEFSTGDPDRFKAKANVNDMMASIMGESRAPLGAQPQLAGSNPQQMAQAMQ